MNKVKQYINVKNFGEARTMLRMEIDQSEKEIHQKKYIEKLQVLYGMKDCCNTY